MRAALSLWIALCAIACTSDVWDPAELAEGHASSNARTLALGRELYGQYCVGCHGDSGDGNGLAARFLDPKPRDLRLGKLKFAGVASGDPPRDEDYQRTIERGLHGTAMPSFALLTQQERAALVAYVRELIEPAKRKPAGTALGLPKDPWTKDPDRGAAVGERLYHTQAKCWSCHPAYATTEEIAGFHRDAGLPLPELRPQSGQSLVTESSWDAKIRAPDFMMDRVKTGIEAESLVRVIQAGIGGTAMPTWAGTFAPDELWGLAYYVRSLAVQRGSPEAVAMRRSMSPPEVKP